MVKTDTLCNTCYNKPICKYCKICNDTIKEIDVIRNEEKVIVENDSTHSTLNVSVLMQIDVSCVYFRRTYSESNVRTAK